MPDLAADPVEPQWAGLEHIWPRRLPLALIPAQDGPHSRQQLAHTKGLDHVVDRAQFQPRNAMGLVLQCRQNDDRYRTFARKRPADGETIQPWQHNVEDYQIRLETAGLLEASNTIGGQFYSETGPPQVITERFAQNLLIFDDKNCRHSCGL